MDREARQEYDVVIQAKDMGGHMGGLSGTTEVKITLTDVNDNPPKFPQSEYKHGSIYMCYSPLCDISFKGVKVSNLPHYSHVMVMCTSSTQLFILFCTLHLHVCESYFAGVLICVYVLITQKTDCKLAI